MKDEIKEIFEKPNVYILNDDIKIILKEDLNKLKDYIANLQEKVENQRQELVSLNDRLKEVKKSNGFLKQENERLKENAIHNDKVVDKAKWNEMIYKSRIEKTIDFISKKIRDVALYGDQYFDLNELLQILQGVGKDE